MLIVETTCANGEEAGKIARALVEEGLVACANRFPVKSCYRWKGEIVEEEEFVLWLKCTEKNYAKVEARIKELHSFELPAITAFKPDRVSKEFGEWVTKQKEGG